MARPQPFADRPAGNRSANLSGETCLVTGAIRIGRAIATELARREARVLAGVRDLDRWQP